MANLLYTDLRLAKEIQLHMWVRLCLATVDIARGRVRGGVTIHTRWRSGTDAKHRLGTCRRYGWLNTLRYPLDEHTRPAAQQEARAADL